MDSLTEINRQKTMREIEATEAAKGTYQEISEFREIVEKFVFAANENTKSTQKQNFILVWFTIAASLATIVSAIGTFIQLRAQGLI